MGISWTATNSYPVGIDQHSCVAYNGYVYCFGGDAASIGITGLVYYAPLLTPGIGTWQSSSNSLPVVTNQASCAISNGYVYCVGFDAPPYNGAYYAPLLNPGVGAWDATNSLPTPNAGGNNACTIYNGYIYCFASQFSFYYAPILNPGIGSWTSSNMFGGAYGWESGSGGAIFADNNIMYMENTGYGEAYYAPIINPGVSTWQSQGQIQGIGCSTTILGCAPGSGYVYCTGGCTWAGQFVSNGIMNVKGGPNWPGGQSYAGTEPSCITN